MNLQSKSSRLLIGYFTVLMTTTTDHRIGQKRETVKPHLTVAKGRVGGKLPFFKQGPIDSINLRLTIRTTFVRHHDHLLIRFSTKKDAPLLVLSVLLK
jgi:hypothetical protein